MCNFVTLVVSHLSRGMLCVHFCEYGIKVKLRQSAWRGCRWCLRSLFKLDLVNYLSSNQNQLLMVSWSRIRIAQQSKIVSIILTKDRKKDGASAKRPRHFIRDKSHNRTIMALDTGLFLNEKCNIHVVLWGSYHNKPKEKGISPHYLPPDSIKSVTKKTNQKVYLSRRSLDSRVQQTVQ